MTFAYSVVIPAHNAARTIAETIASIVAQTVRPQEILVADDGSTDGTAAVALACPGPVSVVAQANSGPGAATTAGFRRVTTPYFATLDADDLWLPHKIAVQAREFQRDPELAGVFSLAREFIDGQAADPNGPGSIRRLWTRTTMLLRTEAARAVGDFHDFPGRLGEVIDWLSRSSDLGHRYAMVEEVLAMRRVRAGSLTYRLDAERARGYLAAVHNALKRRAGAPKREAETPET